MEIKVTKIVAVGPVEKSTTGFYRALTIELETGARHSDNWSGFGCDLNHRITEG